MNIRSALPENLTRQGGHPAGQVTASAVRSWSASALWRFGLSAPQPTAAKAPEAWRTPRRRRAQAAFTMVEIALSLAIIGFALLAVIGTLPIGLQVQRENREETIINQDANVWLSAIRNGARGYDDLTNYMDAITNYFTDFKPDGTVRFRGRDGFDQTNSDIQSITSPPIPFLPLNRGSNIVGLLSTPKYAYYDVANQIIRRSNYVVAYVRAMSGAATEKFPQDNANVRDLAFRYRMISEVVPFAKWDPSWVASGNNANYWLVAANTYTNLHDIRLLFRWPLLPAGKTGNGRQAFRTQVSGQVTNEFGPLYFFNPRTYVRYQ
jgi:type II secretory pathway pseudopilin PulG